MSQWPATVWLVLLLAPISSSADPMDADLALLKSKGIKTENASLLQVLRERSLTAEEEKKVQQLVRDLGARSFRKRENATHELVRRGSVVLPALKKAIQQPDKELVRRAKGCIAEIEQEPDAGIPMAVIRILKQRRTPGAVEALLLFLPFAMDAYLEELIFNSILHLATSKLAPKNEKQHAIEMLQKAAVDSIPKRRAAAGHVLSRVESDSRLCAKLLSDSEAEVRFHTALGLLLSGKKNGADTLISLLEKGPMQLAWQAEELLVQLAQAESASIAYSGESTAQRRAWSGAWKSWWKAHRTKVDLSSLRKPKVHLGRTLVPLMHSNLVYECDRQGKRRWEIKDIPQPRDAQILPGGRVLVAEASTQKVTERDRLGKVLWTYKIQTPSFCRRLPNGNTIVGSTSKVLEVTPDGKTVFSYAPKKPFHIHSMDRKANGHFVLLSMAGILQEVDRKGNVISNIKLKQAGISNWCGVDALKGGRFLVVAISPGKVLEVNRKGEVLWSYDFRDACFAQQLPNNHILVGSFNQKLIQEITRDKKVVWKHETVSTPWRFYQR